MNCINISFAKLGHEECESCLKYKHHECTGNNCVECKAYNTDHTGRRNLARKEYSTDKEKAEKKEKDRLYYSLDLQKVRMLPEIPGSKSTVFTQRICAYNETFSPVGKRVGDLYAILWHQGIKRRNDEDITSAVVKFLVKLHCDLKEITIWMDN